ncbi:MAG: CoA-acylating methylmalonate-semialdehyde dehydrogenase [Firmicutes bacterium]|nr:CoA-acylating methylmalonate-semialdehyde dehydrogenase [Bacillota bacterium]
MIFMQKLKLFINNEFVESKAKDFYEVFNPSTGAVLAKSPKCLLSEAESAVASASSAFKTWRYTPVIKRVQVLHKVRALIEERLDDLTLCVATEHGKTWAEAQGDVLKAKEATEHAIAMPELMMGESLMDTSSGYDTVLYRESVGVYLGIAPFNFPAMIPMGWMVPLCIACGNTMVLKASSATPMTSLKFAEIYKEAGLPSGVLNVITCGREEAEALIAHPEVKGISFVGSTSVGLSVYKNASIHGKRVQALCEAKNHALVLNDAPIKRVAAGIINASFGCAGERCMALPVVVAESGIADALVAELIAQAKALKIGPAYDKTSQLGPVYSASHKESVLKWIEKGIKEGAKLVLDGRNATVKGYEKGFYLAPTIFDNVTEDMAIGKDEIFGPVLCIKRVNSFNEGLALMNNSEFANGSVIYTQNGYFAREFAKKTDGGMVGINVGIPVPVGLFPFSGHKKSFFGDLHTLGKDAVMFYTETKCVTTHWFTEEEKLNTKVSTWDGTI